MAVTYRGGVSALDRSGPVRARFPALDPEPPPRPWWWRVAVAAGVLAVAAAVAAAVAFWPSSAAVRPAPAVAPPPRLPAAVDRGLIVTLDRAGYLVLADPDGTHPTRLSTLGSEGHDVAAAPDGRYLSVGNGQFLVVRNGATLAAYPAKVPLSSNNAAAWPDSFADHDRDVVMLLDYGDSSSSTENPVTVYSLGTGSSRSLGVADSVAGDPQAAGAFVSVAAPPQASATVTPVIPDSRVELRDAARPAVVLATAGSIDRDLGQSPDQSVQLIPYPDPSGDKVAVVVQPVSGSEDGAGIVVLNRTGRVVATAATPFGIDGLPAWSPSGASLAYASTGNAGRALFIWTVGGHDATRSFASDGDIYSLCVWSPDGRSILCTATAAPDAGGPAGPAGWAVLSTSTGVIATVRGAGQPIAWLPGRGGT
jgi:WD40-like Beta Propeller Repeat